MLQRPVPIYTLVFLRIATGLLGGGDILGNGIYYHWMKDEFSGFTFRYYAFEWVQPLPEPFLSLFFAIGFLAGLAVALGWRFRITMPLLAVSYTYLFLLEKAHYLNHGYLFVILCWLLCLTPAWREWSLDVRRKPGEWSPTAPLWSVYVFPALMGIVYFFGGVAKLNYDWLMEAMPLHMWLERRGDMWLLGPLWKQKVTAYVMAWSGMLLDLTVPFLLLHRRLRWVALAMLLFFHLTNHLLFNIGIFPWLSLVLTSMFFNPDWPKRAVDAFVKGKGLQGARARVQRWRDGWRRRVSSSSQMGFGLVPGRPRWQERPGYRKWIAAALVLLFIVQISLPLRHNFYPSDVSWSETGHRFSWRMMLRSKQGYGHFRVVDRSSGEEWIIHPRDSLHQKQARKMATHPDMILQYAHHLRDGQRALGRDVAVYPQFKVRLNGRSYRPFTVDTVDLSRRVWNSGDKDWILPEKNK